MRKEELMKIEGMTDAVAEKVLAAFTEELKGYIPKSRFDEENEAKKNAEALIKASDAQLEDLKKAGTDAEAMKKQIEELQKGNETAKKQYEASIKKMQLDNAVDLALRDAGAKNTKAVMALLSGMDKAELDDKGKVVGLAEQIKALQKSDSYLFETKQPDPNPKPTFSGAAPGGAGGSTGTGTITQQEFAKMGYTQRAELYAKDKALYDSLIGKTQS